LRMKRACSRSRSLGSFEKVAGLSYVCNRLADVERTVSRSKGHKEDPWQFIGSRRGIFSWRDRRPRHYNSRGPGKFHPTTLCSIHPRPCRKPGPASSYIDIDQQVYYTSIGTKIFLYCPPFSNCAQLSTPLAVLGKR
jgi:hypothetical protein